MARLKCRSIAALATLVGALAGPATATLAQTSEWRPDLIAKYESEGGKNLPNNLFDGPYGTRSAGGVCQMLTRNWLRVAPLIDIDTEKFPVAGTATEFDQWRACWKLWTLDGYGAWTCCNAKLKRALELKTAPNPNVSRRRHSFIALWANTRPVERQKNKAELFNDRLSVSSDVYHTTSIAFR